MITVTLHVFCYSIFGHEGQEAEDVGYVNWLALLYQAVGKALEMYQPSTKGWLQVNLSH
jgi:dipeptidyl-peptidase-3